MAERDRTCQTCSLCRIIPDDPVRREENGKRNMAYEVLVRKWRPQRFDDVVGQEHVARTLKNAIEAGRLAQAYLFVGPRGIGKTSIARILARALNCAQGPTINPCGVCDHCREIAAGNSLDVMEIDGASNNGVDQVRDLRDAARFAPARGRYKIYIIDEVHMLSTSAFNALLKTLEEPPPHVKFIFATTEPEKILPTIISRCQRFDLRRIPVAGIVEQLRKIADAEGVTVAEDALLAIARGAEGGLRDAESALDQLIAFCGQSVGEEDVLSVFGLASRAALDRMVEHLLKGEVGPLMELVARLDGAGKDLQRVVAELMESFRHLLVCLSVPEWSGGQELTPAQVKTLRALAGLTRIDRILRMVTLLGEAQDRMRYALSRRTLLETTLIRCARSAMVVTLPELMEQVRALQAQAGTPQTGMSQTGVSQAGTAPGGMAQAGMGVAPPAAVAAPSGVAASGGAPAAEPVPVRSVTPAPGLSEIETLRQAWGTVIQRAGMLAIAIKGALHNSAPLSVTGDTLTVAVDAQHAGSLNALDAPRARSAVEHAVEAVLKRRVAVRYEAGAPVAPAAVAAPEAPVRPTVAPAAAPDAAPAPDAPVAAAPADEGATSRKPMGRLARDLVADPAVVKAMEMFGGRISEVRTL